MAARRSHPILKALEDLDAATLGEVIARAETLRDEKLAEAKAALKAETLAKAKALGLDVEDLFETGRARRGRKPNGRGAKSDVVFRGPQGETWSGRGRPPGWIVALEAKGHKRDKYRV